jgi:DNA-binding MarR family transcriptional regulator
VANDKQLLALWRHLHHANALIRASLGARLDAEGGCSLLEHDLLSLLEVEGPERPRMADLADLLGVTSGGVTRVVDRLIARGWVEREQVPGNRRVIYAKLTAEGRRVLAGTRKAYFAALREVIGDRLTDDRIAELTELTADFVEDRKPRSTGQ